MLRDHVCNHRRADLLEVPGSDRMQTLPAIIGAPKGLASSRTPLGHSERLTALTERRTQISQVFAPRSLLPPNLHVLDVCGNHLPHRCSSRHRASVPCELGRLKLSLAFLGDLQRVCAQRLSALLVALVPLQVVCVVPLDQAGHVLTSLLGEPCTLNR